MITQIALGLAQLLTTLFYFAVKLVAFVLKSASIYLELLISPFAPLVILATAAIVMLINYEPARNEARSFLVNMCGHLKDYTSILVTTYVMPKVYQLSHYAYNILSSWSNAAFANLKASARTLSCHTATKASRLANKASNSICRLSCSIMGTVAAVDMPIARYKPTQGVDEEGTVAMDFNPN